MRVCVTGAAGFVGRATVRCLEACGHSVVALARSIPDDAADSPRVEWVARDLTRSAPLERLGTLDAVVHLAGRAHVMRERDRDPLREFRRVNVEASERLAEAAARAGARRFVFASSIGVHGTALAGPEAVTETSAVDPREPYAISKWEAEACLRRIDGDLGIGLTVLRPALVVGSGAPGNLHRLARLVHRGLPLPVPRGDNARSFIARDNLADLIARCITDERAVGEVFLAAEAEWPSTRQTMTWIGEGMSRPPRFVRVPGPVLRAGARAVGQSSLYDKLFGDLLVDGSRARTRLDWQPEQPLASAFHELGRGLMA